MGSIPVAKPMPMKRPHFGRRLLLGALLALVAVAAIGVAVVVMLNSPGDGIVYAGDVDDLTVDSPRYFERAGFFVVRLEGGEVIALSEVDPRRPNGRICHVGWQPDFEFAGRAGYFRDPCGNSAYLPDGTRIYGPSPRSMDRYEVSIQGDAILVHTDRPLCQSRVDAPWTADACP